MKTIQRRLRCGSQVQRDISIGLFNPSAEFLIGSDSFIDWISQAVRTVDLHQAWSTGFAVRKLDVGK